jgi:hypothetical protein
MNRQRPKRARICLGMGDSVGEKEEGREGIKKKEKERAKTK